MAPRRSSLVLNVEQFIRNVENRPAIWNRNFHCNKAFLEQMWDELASKHKLEKVVLKAKWKGLRDNFRVEFKRIPRSASGEFLVEPATFKSKWVHYYSLLFLTDHMRHRLPKNNEHDGGQSYLFSQHSQDYEKTVVEPDLTNGLIRRMPDSDEEFDEDDIDDENSGADGDGDYGGGGGGNGGGSAGSTRSVRFASPEVGSPPAAHAQPSFGKRKCEEPADDESPLLRSFKKKRASLKGGDDDDDDNDNEKQAEDLTKKNSSAYRANTLAAAAAAAAVTKAALKVAVANMSPASMGMGIGMGMGMDIDMGIGMGMGMGCGLLSKSKLSAMSSGATKAADLAVQQKRLVSPPPLYNKAHNPPPHMTSATAAAAAAATANATSLGQEHDNNFVLNGGSQEHLHHHHHHHQQHQHQHLNFAKYSVGGIPALKLKRTRLSEDCHFNISATMEASNSATTNTTNTTNTTTNTSISTSSSAVPVLSEDDDYHYLLSLYPYMQQLSAAQKLRTRTKIQKLIFKELYKEDLEEPPYIVTT